MASKRTLHSSHAILTTVRRKQTRREAMTRRLAMGLGVSCLVLYACAKRGNNLASDTATANAAKPAGSSTASSIQAAAATEKTTLKAVAHGHEGSAAIENLHDNAWNTVSVEVREGRFVDCNQNAVARSGTMHKGDTWAFSSYNRVCWRRDGNPDNPNGIWTGWSARDVFPD